MKNQDAIPNIKSNRAKGFNLGHDTYCTDDGPPHR